MSLSFGRWASRHRLRFAALIATLVLTQAGVFYTKITSTTEQSLQSALEEFRAHRRIAPALLPLSSPRRASVRPVLVSHQHSQVSAVRAKPSLTPSTTARRPAKGPDCNWACVTVFASPREGVYEWLQCGRSSGRCTGNDSEPAANDRIGVVHRSLPRRGRRILNPTAPAAWTQTHYGAKENRQDLEISVDRHGFYDHRFRVEISLAGFSRVVDVRMDPPVKAFSLPNKLGQHWSGSWVDRNRDADGSYTAAVIGRHTFVIGGVPIRTWEVELHVQLLGPKTKGEMLVRLWGSPALRQTVQDYYHPNITNGGISYEGELMGTLASLRAQR